MDQHRGSNTTNTTTTNNNNNRSNPKLTIDTSPPTPSTSSFAVAAPLSSSSSTLPTRASSSGTFIPLHQINNNNYYYNSHDQALGSIRFNQQQHGTTTTTTPIMMVPSTPTSSLVSLAPPTPSSLFNGTPTSALGGELVPSTPNRVGQDLITDFDQMTVRLFREKGSLWEHTAKSDFGDSCETLVNNINSLVEHLLNKKERIKSENGRYFIKEFLNRLVRSLMSKNNIRKSLAEVINLLFSRVIALFVSQLEYYLLDKKEEEAKFLEKREKAKNAAAAAYSSSSSITVVAASADQHQQPSLPRSSSSTSSSSSSSSAGLLSSLAASLPSTSLSAARNSNATECSSVSSSKEEAESRKDAESEAYILCETVEIIMQCRNPFYANNSVYAQHSNIFQKDVERWSAVMNANSNATWNTNYDKFIFAFPTKTNRHLSSFFLRNVNTFGQVGGYVLLFGLFQNRMTTLPIFKKCLRIFQKSVDGMYRIQDELVPLVKQILMNYINSFDDEFLRTESWDNLKEIVPLSNSLLKRYQPDRAQELTEVVQLELLLKILTSDIIEKRLFALNEIKNFIKECEAETAVKKTSSFQHRFLPSLQNFSLTPLSPSTPLSAASASSTNKSTDRVIRWHTLKQLTKWIEEKCVLENIFENNAHLELIKQSKFLILFLAEQRGLKLSEVELIWKSTVGKYEAIQRAVYDLILGILPSLNSQTTNLFFDQIEMINESYLKEHTLEFIKQFIIEANTNLRRTKEKKARTWNGLVIFWRLIMNEKLSNRVSQKAFECIISLVSREEFEAQRKSMIKSCLVNLKEHRCVPRSLLLIQTILKTYPNIKKKKASLSGMIEYMNEKTKLFDLFILDMNFAASAYMDTKPDAPKGNIAEVVHLSDTQTRLEFLLFILKNSPMCLTFSHCVTLWTTLYDKPMYRNVCCQFFEALIKTDSNIDPNTDVFLDGVLEKIFNDLVLTNVHVSTMTQAEFSFFLTYFLAVNIKNKLLQVIQEEELADSKHCAMESRRKSMLLDPSGNEEVKERLVPKLLKSKSLNQVAHTAGRYVKQQLLGNERKQDSSIKRRSTEQKKIVTRYVVQSAELIGIDHLWSIILLAHDTSVAQQAILKVNNFRHDFSKDMKALVGEYTEAHITKCLESIRACLQSTEDTLRDQKVIRCLELLIDYLYLFGEKTGVRGHGISSAGVPVRIRVCPIGEPKFSLTLQSTDSISRLYAAVSTELNLPVYLLQLFSSGAELLNEDKTLEDLKIKDYQIIIAKRINIKDVGLSLIRFQLKALGLEAVAEALVKQEIEQSQQGICSVTDEFTNQTTSSLTQANDTLEDKYVMLFTDDEKSYPTNILSRPENFSTLFSLLEMREEVAEIAWTLILHLPTDTQMSSTIQNLSALQNEDQVDWQKILPKHGSPHKYLYSLQIIDCHLKKQLNNNESELWSKNFIHLGGVKQLIDSLIETQESAQSSTFALTTLQKECLALKIKIINRFLPTCMRDEQTANKIDVSQIISAVLAVVPRSISLLYAESPSHSQEGDTLTVSKRPTSKKYQFNQGFLNILDTNFSMPTDRALIEHMMDILSTTIMVDPKTFEVFCSATTFLQFLASCLIDSAMKEVRIEIANGLEQLLLSRDDADLYIQQRRFDAKNMFINILYRYFDQIEDHKDTCEQYFMLLEQLLMDNKKYDSQVPSQNCQSILLKILKLILERPVKEERDTSAEDKVMIGLLNIASALLYLNPHTKELIGSKSGIGMIEEVFNSFLFQTPSAVYGKSMLPRCKTTNSRNAAFKLLVELSRDCSQNYLELLKLTSEYLSMTERHSGWCYNTESMERSELGFVGLKNLGATCYMNSLLQQLFMIPPLRSGVLAVNIPNPTKNENTEVLYQMQTMFGFLLYSAKRFYDTRPFCASYKVDGAAINVSQQQDATEFFNIFLDKIERELKGTPQEHLLKQVFGGNILHQLIYENTVSETLEPYSVIGLDIKNKKNIIESLDLYVAGDMLDGNNKYYSDKLQRHVDALKRAVIKDLPNVLIFQLKRFEFDFDSMKHVKVNDRCEFPLRLDMEPYTEEGMERRERRNLKDVPPEHRDDDYYQYRLVGVLVHMGSADSGHYYSYIMDRSSQQQKWYEFNDTKIHHFDESQLDEETFGGLEEVIVKDQGKPTVSNRFYRSNNAYMLFYQRVSTLESGSFENELNTDVTPLDVPTLSPADVTELSNGNDTHESDDNGWNSPAINAVRLLVKLSAANRLKEAERQIQVANLTRDIRKAVLDDNSRFYHDKNVYSEDFDNFIWVLLVQGNYSPEVNMLNAKFATKYLMDIVAHSTFTHVIDKWFDYLSNMFVMNKDICTWFVNTVVDTSLWRSEMLLKCPHAEFRNRFALLLVDCCKVLAADELYDTDVVSPASPSNVLVLSEQQEERTSTVESKPVNRSATIIRRLVNSILSSLGECRYFSRQTEQYFMFLSHFARIGIHERKYLIQKGLISMLVQLLNGESPDISREFLFNKRTRTNGLSSIFGVSASHHLLELLSLLVVTCETTSSQKNSDVLPPTMMRSKSDSPIELPVRDRDKLFHREFFACLIHDDSNSLAIQSILSHWCWENMHVTLNFTDTIIKELTPIYSTSMGTLMPPNTANRSQLIEKLLVSIETIVSISDSIHQERVNEVMKKFLRHVQSLMKDYEPASVCLNFLTALSQKLDSVSRWVQREENATEVEKIRNAITEWNARLPPHAGVGITLADVKVSPMI